MITREAASEDGVFTVHRIKDRLFYEIPKDDARPRVPLGQPDRRARRSAPATAARPPAIASSAGSAAAIASSCAACPTTSVADREGPDRARRPRRQLRPDRDVVQHRGARQRRRAGDRSDAAVHHRRPRVQRPHPRRARAPSTRRARSSIAPSRSRRTSRSRRPRPTTTRRTTARAAAARRRRRPAAAAARTPVRPGSASVVMHYSMVLLPEKPMQARLFDERVGYFSTGTIDYSQDEHRAPSAGSSRAVGSRRRTRTPRCPSR